MKARYRCIARVEKSHGRRGEVVTVPVHGLPSLVREGLEVAVVPPRLKGSRWHTVTCVSHDSRAGSLTALSGVCSLADAEPLVGRFLLAREEDLPHDLALHDRGRLVGREVLDECSGRSGVISEILTGPANDVWVLRDSSFEVLVPVVDEVVCDVPQTGPITVRVPRGLEWEERDRL